MAGVISEDYLSRPFTLARQSGRELVYNVTGTDDETEVQNLLTAAAPASYLGLTIESIEAEPLGGGNWKGYAKYVFLADDSEYTFSTGGGTQKVTQSLGTTAYGSAYSDAPDFGGAIGVTEDSVEGCDVPVPQFEFSETHRFANTSVTDAYKLAVRNLTGKVNDAPFKGHAAGEVLFLGATGAKRGDELWQITFNFSASPNQTGLSVGTITGIDKEGWQYLWVRYADFDDGTTFSLVKRPVAAYVETVILSGDFSLLGIGT